MKAVKNSVFIVLFSLVMFFECVSVTRIIPRLSHPHIFERFIVFLLIHKKLIIVFSLLLDV